MIFSISLFIYFFFFHLFLNDFSFSFFFIRIGVDGFSIDLWGASGISFSSYFCLKVVEFL